MSNKNIYDKLSPFFLKDFQFLIITAWKLIICPK